jgi:hypothetical protein
MILWQALVEAVERQDAGARSARRALGGVEKTAAEKSAGRS